jgi:undecaprenyl-diphosphatase
LNLFLISIILGIIQGLTELLPVSSSAHVVVAERLMGLDPSSPEMTLLLVMLHTGTMLAVIAFFWRRWQSRVTATEGLGRYALMLVIATLLTGIIGEALLKMIEKTWFRGTPHAEVEMLFSHLELIAPALALVGVLIIVAGVFGRSEQSNSTASLAGTPDLDSKRATLIGAVQGLCLPFRGFSRSGATISTAMLAGVERRRAEDFSFALAVILTPPVVAREAMRLMRAEHLPPGAGLASAFSLSLLGFVSAFFAGLLALKWLSKWLEQGRWHWFGIYCLIAAAAVAYLHHAGY